MIKDQLRMYQGAPGEELRISGGKVDLGITGSEVDLGMSSGSTGEYRGIKRNPYQWQGSFSLSSGGLLLSIARLGQI